MGGAVSNFWNSIKTVVGIVFLLWAVFALSLVFPIEAFGIRPRSLSGLPGILLAPFIHADIGHLIANSISLLVLGTVFVAMHRGLPVGVTLFIVVATGLGTWLIGRSHYVHIGASGIIYGMLGYLLAMGFFLRNAKAIIISIGVFILYGGMVWGIFPSSGFISWESHLCGFFAGVGAARMYAEYTRKRSR